MNGANVTEFDCAPAGIAIGFPQAVPVFTIGAHTVGTACADGNTCASPSISLLSTSNKLLVFSNHCVDAACGGVAPTVASWTGPNISGCTLLTGTRTGAGTGIGGVEAALCSITRTGPATVTANYSAAAVYPQVGAIEIGGLLPAPDDGVGKGCIGTSMTASCSTNGSTTQKSELVISVHANGAYVGFTGGSGTIIDNASGGNWVVLTEYAVSSAAGQQSASASLASNTGWTSFIAALK